MQITNIIKYISSFLLHRYRVRRSIVATRPVPHCKVQPDSSSIVYLARVPFILLYSNSSIFVSARAIALHRFLNHL